VLATLNGFPQGDTVELGSYELSPGYCVADASGSCSIAATVSPAPSGTYAVIALDVSTGLQASAQFTILPEVTIEPTAGLAGSTVTASMSGFEAGETINVSFGSLVPPLLVATCTANAGGSCVTSLLVPSGMVGNETVNAQGSTSGLEATTSFVEQPGPDSVSLSQPSAPFSSSLTATAGGFAAGEAVEFSFDGTEIGSCVASVENGQCAATVVVPAVPAGSYEVSANGADGDSATTSFTVVAGISLSHPAGQVGSTLTATAGGFEPGETIDFTYAFAPVGSCAAGANGSCSVNLTIPAGPNGPDVVTATGATSGMEAMATFYETGPLSLVLTPSTGSGGGFSASASGFVPGESISISYQDLVFESCNADMTGACSVTMPYPPAGPPRAVTVTAVGSNSGFQATATFTTLPGLETSPGAGTAGSTLYLGPEGFAAAETVQLVVDGIAVGSCTTGSTGDCPITAVVVPSVPAGNVRVVATDQDGNVASRIFAVEPSVALSPQSGPAGTTENATAKGFEPGETVELSYASALVGSCTASSNGSCPVAFAVPAEHAGSYPIAATGQSSGLTADSNFSESPTFTLSPMSGPQGSNFVASVLGYAANEVVRVTFDGPVATLIGSCTADANGDCSTTLVVPTDPGGKYFLSANGASSGDWSVGSFTVTPTVTVNPASGSGGQTVTFNVSGFGLVETVDLSMNGTAIGSCAANASGDCTTNVLLPSEPAGTSTITASGATTGLTAVTNFTVIAPTVTAVSPNDGKLAAGTSVTINGTNFLSGASVRFGTVTATSVTVVNSTTITAKSPAGTGAVDITVATSQGTSAITPADVFTYLGVPTVTGVSPAAGSQRGGAVVTLTGTNFYGPATVYFGGVKATAVTVVNTSTIVVTSPAATGTQNVRVVTSSGESATSTADRFEYFPPPTVTKVAPATGPAKGGTTVTISGIGFLAPAEVSFGGVPATKVVVYSANRIGAVSPAGTAGTANVTVTTPYGSSATSTLDHFTYQT
jgi:hypothetical protein